MLRTEPDSPPTPRGPGAEADSLVNLRDKALRWNFFCNIADGALAIFSFTVVSGEYVVPAFLRKAGASDTLLGLLSATVPAATAAVPIFAAHYVQRLPRKKPYVVVGGIFQRLHLFILPLLAVAVLPRSAGLFFSLYVLSAVVSAGATQAVMPAWADLVAKVTPVTRRGFLWAWRWNLGMIPAVLLGPQIRHVLNALDFPWNYCVIFLAGAVAFAVSLPFVAMIRERGGQVGKPSPGLGAVLRVVPRMLGRDRPFAWFLLSQALTALAAGMVGVFFVLTAQDRFRVRPEDVLGGYMAVGFGSTVVGNLLFSRLGDRLGHRLNLVLSGPLLAAACLWAMLAGDPLQYGLAFVLVGLATAARNISNLLIVMEFGGEHERPRYMAMYTTMLAVPTSLGPLLGGLLRDHVSLATAFFAAVAMSLAGAAVLVWLVRDPRTRNA